ncbi:MAG TPA: DNA repair protein RadC [Candidatus Woesebacteria bacterium]|nr:DNA repair protein RadC [Candidatus Woesebacteria bacterium]
MIAFTPQKPREKMCQLGACNLELAELLAIILSTGGRQLSAIELGQQLAKVPLSELMMSKMDQLCAIPDIGPAKASILLAAFELAKRFKNHSALVSLDHPQKVFYQAFEIKDRQQEVCMALYLNGSQQLLRKKILTIGSLNQNFIEFREILAPAITLPAYGFILVHNHPSGNSQPSQQDIFVTKKIAQGADLLGVKLLDHVIVTQNHYTSFREIGVLS